MRRFLLVLLVLVAVALGAIYWLLADPNRFKGEIAALIERESGLEVELRGDLSWRLWPPVRLVARDLTADWEPTSGVPLVAVDSLELDADLWPLITGEKRLNVKGIALAGLHANLTATDGRANWLPPGSAKTKSLPLPIAAAPPDATRTWEVAVVTLRDSRIDYDLDGNRSSLDIEEIIVADVSPGRTSPIRAKVTYATDSQRAALDLRADVTATHDAVEIAAGELTGSLSQPTLPFSTTFTARYDIPNERLAATFDASIESLTIPTPQAVTLGGAAAAAVLFAAPAITTTAAVDLDAPVLPLGAIRTVDWDGLIRIARLHHDGADFADVRMETANTAGVLTGVLTMPHFFGGQATADWSIDASNDPQWHLAPAFSDVNSQALLQWLGKTHEWVAMLVANSDVRMAGNTRRELSRSLAARADFDGGRGRLDIRALREAALSIAKRAGGLERIEAWPEVLDYQRFTGTWNVNGIEHRGRVLLDNLSFELDGTLDPLNDAIDFAIAVTVLSDAEIATFQIDPLLMGLALPLRCKGTTDKPDCKADEDGSRKLLAQALSGENPELKARLDKAIDEKVPEQYRDTARSLLELLRKKSN